MKLTVACGIARSIQSFDGIRLIGLHENDSSVCIPPS